MRQYSEDTGWEAARKDLRFTSTRLSARKRHSTLSKPLLALLRRWNELDQQRRDADDAVVDSNALVGALDEELDEEVNHFATRVSYECNGDTAHPTFKAYFPEPPNEIIRLGLESEIDRTRKFATVAKERKASKESAAILQRIADVEQRGEAALKGRKDAYEGTARVSLRIQTWKEDANAVRRGVETALETYAVANKLPRSYADGFFPVVVRSKKNGKGKAADAPAEAQGAAPPVGMPMKITEAGPEATLGTPKIPLK